MQGVDLGPLVADPSRHRPRPRALRPRHRAHVERPRHALGDPGHLRRSPQVRPLLRRRRRACPTTTSPACPPRCSTAPTRPSRTRSTSGTTSRRTRTSWSTWPWTTAVGRSCATRFEAAQGDRGRGARRVSGEPYEGSARQRRQRRRTRIVAAVLAARAAPADHRRHGRGHRPLIDRRSAPPGPRTMVTVPLVAWPSGLGKGLQSPVRGFDSRRHLHPSIAAGDERSAVGVASVSCRERRDPPHEPEDRRRDRHGQEDADDAAHGGEATPSQDSTDPGAASPTRSCSGARQVSRRCIPGTVSRPPPVPGENPALPEGGGSPVSSHEGCSAHR